MFPSPMQLLIVLLVVVLIFGTKKLKNFGQDLGAGIKGFKDGLKDGSKEENNKSVEAIDVTIKESTGNKG